MNLKEYYHLTKPGIVKGNLVTTAGGFLLAAKGIIDLNHLLLTLLGAALAIASGCVFNNYMDRKIDAKMERTQSRALVAGSIPEINALIFGTVLLILGIVSFALFTNIITLFTAILGFIFYVFIYGYFKRKTVHGTLIGSISGATPPVIGYTAVSGMYDLGAFLLFLVLVFWQMPHFYAIGIFRKKEYQKASLPLLPIVKGIGITKKQIFLYGIGFIMATSLLTVFGFTGYVYLAVISAVGVMWVYKMYRGFLTAKNEVWALGIFLFSLKVLIIFSILISLDFAFPF